MINVSDMGRSVAFYRDTLGLPVKFESTEWSEFETGPITLALHGVALAGRSRGVAPAEPTAGTCSLGFSVESLDATYTELQTRGARFVLPPTEQAKEGIRLAVCIDPDGLAISLAEPNRRREDGRSAR